MAIINSYPLVTPKLTDLILGTSAGSNGRNKTASFTVGAMQSLMAGVTSVTSGNVNTIVIGGTTQQPTVGTVTATITLASNSLATATIFSTVKPKCGHQTSLLSQSETHSAKATELTAQTRMTVSKNHFLASISIISFQQRSHIKNI